MNGLFVRLQVSKLINLCEDEFPHICRHYVPLFQNFIGHLSCIERHLVSVFADDYFGGPDDVEIRGYEFATIADAKRSRTIRMSEIIRGRRLSHCSPGMRIDFGI